VATGWAWWIIWSGSKILARVVSEDAKSNGDTFEAISGGEFENFLCQFSDHKENFPAYVVIKLLQERF
jgi:hypothetical protein